MIAIRRLSIFDSIYLYLSTSLLSTTKNHIQHIYNYQSSTTTTKQTTITNKTTQKTKKKIYYLTGLPGLLLYQVAPRYHVKTKAQHSTALPPGGILIRL